jgi:hypothetical protein
VVVCCGVVCVHAGMLFTMSLSAVRTKKGGKNISLVTATKLVKERNYIP